METKRVVITGIGIVSCLGNNKEAVLDSLLASRSGIRFKEEYREMGLRSHIAGSIDIDLKQAIERKLRRFMGGAAGYAYIAGLEAIEDAGLNGAQLSHPRTGLIAGSGGASPENQILCGDLLRTKGIRRVGPYMVNRCMCSTVSASLATAFKIKGHNYSITSACATSAHCIGNAMEAIQAGKQDVVLAGGGDEEHWALSVMFDAMGALSTKYNDTPETASRPYDQDRDGFVIAGGGGIVIVESLEHAQDRGAKIYAELVGYGANSDGYDMVVPSSEGAVRCMKQAMATVDQPVDYINTHGTSTPVGDGAELKAIRETFGERIPPLSSTKSLTGHSLGATGVHEAIYCILMLQHRFMASSANIENLDPDADGMPIIREVRRDVEINTVMSNSFGFGGTNGCLILQRYQDA